MIIFADRRQSNQFDEQKSDADQLRIKKLNLKYAHNGFLEINKHKKQTSSKMAYSDQKPASIYQQIKQRYSEKKLSDFSMNSARTVRDNCSFYT